MKLRETSNRLGINHAKSFSRRSTHLLCPSGTGLKFEKAKEWGIPAIDFGWLNTMATSGMIPPVEDHLANGVVADNGNDTRSFTNTKGKGKAADIGFEDQMDPGFMMNDITNGLFSATTVIQTLIP